MKSILSFFDYDSGNWETIMWIIYVLMFPVETTQICNGVVTSAISSSKKRKFGSVDDDTGQIIAS